MSNSNLIHKLAGDHQKKPFWKKRSILLSLWFFFNVLYFTLAIGVVSKLDFRSSAYALTVSLLASILGWLFFTQLLNSSSSDNKFYISGLASLGTLVGSAFLYDELIARNILHDQPLGTSSGSLGCLGYTLLVTLLPMVLGSFLIRYFFVQNRFWASIFLTFHLGLMAILWIDLTCYDRELWHLVLGHQSSLLGIFGLLIIFSFSPKKLASSAA